MEARAEAARMLSAISRRNAVLQRGASSDVSGGTSRVLLSRVIEALATHANRQVGIDEASLRPSAVRMAAPTAGDKPGDARLVRWNKRERFMSRGQSFVYGKVTLLRRFHGAVNATSSGFPALARQAHDFQRMKVTSSSNLA